MSNQNTKAIPSIITQAADVQQLLDASADSLKKLGLLCMQEDLDDRASEVIVCRGHLKGVLECFDGLQATLTGETVGSQPRVQRRTTRAGQPARKKKRRSKSVVWSYKDEHLIYDCTTAKGEEYTHKTPKDCLIAVADSCMHLRIGGDGPGLESFSWDQIDAGIKTNQEFKSYQCRLALRFLVQSMKIVRKVPASEAGGRRGLYAWTDGARVLEFMDPPHWIHGQITTALDALAQKSPSGVG